MIIDGSAIAEKKLKELKKLIGDRPVHLAAIVIGADEGIKKFVKIKKKAAEFIGATFSSYEFPQEASEQEILETVGYLNADPAVHGIFVELPVPKEYNQAKILNAVAASKDVDALTDTAQRDFYDGRATVLPPVVRALEMVLRELKLKLRGKKAAVFGQGFLVGKPISHWLESQGVEVARIDIDTLDSKPLTLTADLIVSGVGKPGLVEADMVKDDAVVIDFGYALKRGPSSRKATEGQGKISGDVDFDAVSKKAAAVTPVPGGMGPLVVASVLENLVTLAKL